MHFSLGIQKCIFQGSRKISDEQRNKIFKNYILFPFRCSKKKKNLHTTEVDVPCRRKKGKNETNSRKNRTYRYYFQLNDHKIQVSKEFYTGTLCISQKPIYTIQSIIIKPRPTHYAKVSKGSNKNGSRQLKILILSKTILT